MSGCDHPRLSVPPVPWKWKLSKLFAHPCGVAPKGCIVDNLGTYSQTCDFEEVKPMAKLLWREARDQAQKLMDRFGQRGPNVRLVSLCESFGIRVWDARLPSGVSGMIVKEKGEDADIYIDESDPETRQRFTLAHELGHFIERTVVAGDKDFSFRDVRSSNKYDLQEFFADEFAGALLMPVPEFARDKRTMSVAQLADRYKVSTAAVEKRIERLRKNAD